MAQQVLLDQLQAGAILRFHFGAFERSHSAELDECVAPERVLDAALDESYRDQPLAASHRLHLVQSAGGIKNSLARLQLKCVISVAGADLEFAAVVIGRIAQEDRAREVA